MLNENVGEDGAWEMNEARGKEVIFFGKLNPVIAGKRVRVIIQETTTPTDYQAENIETSAKRKGAEGAFILSGGKYIFSNTDVTLIGEDQEVKHVMLESDPETVEENINSEVGV